LQLNLFPIQSPPLIRLLVNLIRISTLHKPLYPHIKVKLTSRDGNSLSIISSCGVAARKGKVPQEEIDRFNNEALSSDYDNVLRTCMKWFNVS
jgi:hypothetical protein